MTHFDLNEANILIQNLDVSNQKKSDFLETLRFICKNTEDPLLNVSLQSLIKKVELLSQEEISFMCSRIVDKKAVATLNDPFSTNFLK